MSKLRTTLLSVLIIALASVAAPGPAAQEGAEEKACARLLPAVESLEALLVQEAKARTAENETQRMQVVMTLLGLRYHNIDALESSLRTYEAEDDDIRGALARSQAQLEALDEAARSSVGSAPDPQRKAERAEVDAILKGLEERARGLRERKASDQVQLALERRDIEKLEAVVRAWVEKTP